MNTRKKSKIIVYVLALMLTFSLFACVPPDPGSVDRFPIIDDDQNQSNKDKTTRDEAVTQTTNAITSLTEHLESETVSETGYYTAFDFVINTDNHSAFRLKMRANLYTYPYIVLDENGEPVIDEATGRPKEDPEKLAKHNEIIKKSDIILEWFDGITNKMLIGFYYDGVNSNSADRGNNLYLNLQGSKRIFAEFGDSVLFQQMIRLITSLDIINIIDESGGTSQMNDYIGILLRSALEHKVVFNNDDKSYFYKGVQIGAILDTVNTYLQDIFGPFQDKLDPLTNKYLGFNFSTLAYTTIKTLSGDMQFFAKPQMDSSNDILSGVVVDLEGSADVYNPKTSSNEIVNFTTQLGFDYDSRPSTSIVFDKKDYILFEYGKYEYQGNLYLPSFDLNLDALIRTDINEHDNKANRIYATFHDKANKDLIIGTYYTDEKMYIDVTGLQHLYGGVKLEDIGLPKAYKSGIDISQLYKMIFDFADQYIIAFVDDFLYPSDDSMSDELTNALMRNLVSTVKDPDDPSSRNTMTFTIDIQLIKAVIKETSEDKKEPTNDELVEMINQMFNIDIQDYASILGMSTDTLMNNTFIKIRYDVDDSSIRVEVFQKNSDPQKPADLFLRLDLTPIVIGQAVTITFPEFTNFKELKDVMTYSTEMSGTIAFSGSNPVDFSQLLGSFIGDISGLNTPFTLPASAELNFTLDFDQYIREQTLENGRWVRRDRKAIYLNVWMIHNSIRTDLFKIYANDVSFSSTSPKEDLGYIWVDMPIVPGLPKMKIREDIFGDAFGKYMAGNDAFQDGWDNFGITTLLRILMEDSVPIFEPDVIRMTTSNQFFKDLFKVENVLADIEIKVGLKQRVKDIDELEKDFAMYTVGKFSDINGVNPYMTDLHKEIAVTFDFGSRIEKRMFKVVYDYSKLTVNAGTKVYSPTLLNSFMGVERSYKVTITGGLSAQKKIQSLDKGRFNAYWEPLLPMPSTVRMLLEDGSSEFYNANFDLDWSKITIAGLANKDVILTVGGEYRLATYTEKVTITVIDRRIKNMGTVSLSTKNGKVSIPIVNKIAVDPYQYLIQKAAYQKANPGAIDFASKYFGDKAIGLDFINGETEDIFVKLAWEFDFANGGLYSEKDISNIVNRNTYMYTTFQGQLIALQVVVESRTLDFVKFENETQNNTYTIDALTESTFTIPKNPIIYFKEINPITGEAYSLNLAELESMGFELRWTKEKVDNIYIDGDQGRPLFDGMGENTISAFLDFRQFFNDNTNWFTNDWFNSPIITIDITCPPCNVAKGQDITNNAFVEKDGVVVKESFATGKVDFLNSDGNVVGSDGIISVDPFNKESYKIPTRIDVYFDREGGGVVSRRYTIAWADGIFVKIINGEYFLDVDMLMKNNPEDVYLNLVGYIGDREDSKAEISIAIKRLTMDIIGMTYFDSMNKTLTSGTDTEIPLMAVNSHKGFELPTKAVISFKNGTERTYETIWDIDGKLWTPGSTHSLVADLINYDGYIKTLSLKLDIEDTSITKIELSNAIAGDPASVNFDYVNKSITFENIQLSATNQLNVGGNNYYLYQYINRLCQNLQLTLNSLETVIKDNVIINNWERLFDTQKAFTSEGLRGMYVSLGQGQYADDFEIIIKANPGFTITDGQSKSEVIDLFDKNNNFLYPNGLILSDLVFILKGKINDVVSEKEFRNLSSWYVVESTISGVTAGTFVKSIDFKDGENTYKTGYVLMNYLLDDGTMLERRYTVMAMEIGTDYATSENNRFRIDNGVLTIDDFYAFYPLTTNINADTLPTSIILTKSGINIEVGGVQWTITNNNLSAYSYLGVEVAVEVARGRIMGQDIILKMIIKPCDVSQLSYTDANDATKNFVSETMANGAIKFIFNPYDHVGYAGTFSFPTNITAHYSNGKSHTFGGTQRIYYYMGSSNVTSVGYGYSGALVGGEVVGQVTVTFTLPDSLQRITWIIEFGNSAVSNIEFLDKNDQMIGENNLYIIDPYGDISLPSKIRIRFNSGHFLIIENPRWTTPNGYTVNYKGSTEDYDVKSTLVARNIATQQLSIKIRVLNRTVSEYTLTDKDGGDFGTVKSERDSLKYSISDPFKTTVSDIPSMLKGLKFVINTSGQLIDLTKLNIVWAINNDTIALSGTTGMIDKYLVVRGHLLNSSVGQEFILHLYIDRWDFESVHRKSQNSGEFTELNPITFIFTEGDGNSIIDSYKLVFRVYRINILNGEVTTQTVDKMFYPEENDFSGAFDSDYRLVWDKNAKDAAKYSTLSVMGSVRLVNRLFRGEQTTAGTKFIINNVYYLYEKMMVTKVDFGYNPGGTYENNAVLVIDPYNISFPKSVLAYGNKNQMLNVELGMLDISVDPSKIKEIPHKYFTGGIYSDFPISIIKKKVDGVEYKQNFKIKLVFLDRTPTNMSELDIKFGQIAKTELNATFKSVYATDDYVGVVNPYGSSYTSVYSYLNTYLINNETTVIKQTLISSIIWQSSVPDTGIKDLTIYASSFKLFANTPSEITVNYNRLIKMVVNAR